MYCIRRACIESGTAVLDIVGYDPEVPDDLERSDSGQPVRKKKLWEVVDQSFAGDMDGIPGVQDINALSVPTCNVRCVLYDNLKTHSGLSTGQ